MVKHVSLCAAVILTVAGSCLMAQADDTGVSIIHPLVRIGGRTCFDGHYHYGTGTSKKSRAEAMRASIRAWQEFTAFEYGSDWARYSRAARKRVGCSKESSTTWSCTAEAIPCRSR